MSTFRKENLQILIELSTFAKEKMRKRICLLKGDSTIMMKQLKAMWKGLLTMAFAIAVFMICIFPYRALMNYHEQRHLFRWNIYYFQEQCTGLDGLCEYVVSWMTQFFYIGWLGAAVIAVLAVAIQQAIWLIFRLIRINKAIVYPFTFIPSILLFYYVFIPQEYKDDSQFREAVEYDYLVRAQKWNRILGKSYNHPPETMNGIWCTNYALGMKGMLLDDMFYYKQDGPDGLLMDALRIHPLALYSLSDISFEIGMINSAERFAFDVKQRLPDNHKSGRIYQRLAEANLVNGHYKIARRYMHVLQSTLFYGRWANHYLAILGDEQAIDNDARYGALRLKRQKQNDQLMYAKDQILAQLVEENPKNKLAADYLLAYTMLRLDLEKVTDYTLRLKDKVYQHVPKAVQESIAGYWILSHPNDSLPMPIGKEIFQTTASYFSIVNKTGNMFDPSLDVPPYNQSYWHYHTQATVKLKQQRP